MSKEQIATDAVFDEPTVAAAVAKIDARARKAPVDYFDEQAWTMAHVHRMFINHFKSQYDKAPGIAAKDYPDFLFYSLTAVDNLDHHHHLEEETIFPMMEKHMPGKMAGNVAEHAVFDGDVKDAKLYLTQCLADTSKYTVAEHRRLIGNLVRSAVPHLAAELDTLDGELLKRYFKEEDLRAMDKVVEKQLQLNDPFTFFPSHFIHLPPHEGPGKAWPPIPFFPMRILGPYVFYWKHRNSWKYGTYNYGIRQTNKA